jgi:hypothetical protein
MKTFRFRGFCLGLVLASTLHLRTAAAADVPISEKARAHFNAGVSLVQDPDGARYEEAYSEFRAAYADSPSWKILGNLGITAMKLERDGEAIEAFKKYLAQGAGSLEADEKAQVQRDLDTLTAGLVTLELSSLPAGASVIDERIPVQGNAIKNGYGPLADKLTIGVHPGQHRITAHLDGYQDQVWTVDARSGSSHQHQFGLKEVADSAASLPTGAGPSAAARVPMKSARPIPTSVYIGLAATGALAVGTGIVGALSLSKHSDFDSKNDGLHTSEAQDLKDSGKTLNLVTDVLLGGAVVAGGITAVLYFSRPRTTVDHGRLRVTPLAGPQLAGVSLTGGF